MNGFFAFKHDKHLVSDLVPGNMIHPGFPVQRWQKYHGHFRHLHLLSQLQCPFAHRATGQIFCIHQSLWARQHMGRAAGVGGFCRDSAHPAPYMQWCCPGKWSLPQKKIRQHLTIHNSLDSAIIKCLIRPPRYGTKQVPHVAGWRNGIRSALKMHRPTGMRVRISPRLPHENLTKPHEA